MNAPVREVADVAPPGFVRIPGLFRRAELEPIDKLEPGFHVVGAGSAPDGTELVAVYQRDRGVSRGGPAEPGPVSVEIVLPDEYPGRGRLIVRYCDACHCWGERRSVHLCGVNWHARLAALLQELAKEGRAAR
jgi:hypothetical protein